MRTKILLLFLCALPLFAAPPAKMRVYNDSTRLASLLQDTQSRASLSPASWKAIANEANALANRIYANARGDARPIARDAREHVRELHHAAVSGDAAGAQSHAGMALPFVYRLIDWSAPK
jgi:hypothetical protein